jgi:hypothetical protein
VGAPDFTVAVSPATATITPGQSVAATLTINPVAGYSGTVNFSCTALPSLAACTFAPSSVTPGNGTAATTKLTITTTAPSAETRRGAVRSLQPIVWASVVFLLFLPGRWLKVHRYRIYSLLLVPFLISLSGCGGSNTSSSGDTTPSAPSAPGTPTGMQTITVSANDSTGKLSHSVTLQVVVQ